MGEIKGIIRSANERKAFEGKSAVFVEMRELTDNWSKHKSEGQMISENDCASSE